MIRAAVLALLLMLPACAERWTRAGTTEAETEAVLDLCADEAGQRHSPILGSRPIPDHRREYDRTCRHVRGREECETRLRPGAPTQETVDLATERREIARRVCMRARGFTLEGHDPLRL